MGRDNREDDVFMPKDNKIILEDGEMNEIDRELEEFKRFCLMIKPLKNRPKVAVQVNLKDQFWSGRTTFSYQNWSGRTIFSWPILVVPVSEENRSARKMCPGGHIFLGNSVLPDRIYCPP